MPLKMFVITCLIFVSLCSQAAVQVVYRISKVHGLFNFTMAISGRSHQSPVLKENFIRSSHNSPQNEKLLNQVTALFPSFDRSLDFITSESNRNLGTSVYDQFVIQSIFSKDLNDFSQRTLGLLPLSEHRQFFESLKKLEPVYNEVIWKKSHRDLIKQKTLLEKLARQHNLNSMFAKAEKFYGASWPKEVPFVIGLYPIPFLKNFKNSTNSHSLASVEEHGVLTGTKSRDPQGSFGVIFHELCHSLYDAQSEEFMKIFSKWFSESPSPYRYLAAAWFNEAAATAIGNGWAYQIANQGKLEKENWYNKEIIDGFGKGIYPLTTKYLEQNQTIDQAYVNSVIEIFAQKFPDEIYKYENRFDKLTILMNLSDWNIKEIKSPIRSAFDPSSFSIYSTFSDLDTALESDSEMRSLMFVFRGSDLKEIPKIGEKVPALKKYSKEILNLKARTLISWIGDKSKPYVVIRADKKEDFRDAIEKLKSLGKIDPNLPVQEY